jgi:hypothetical protein
MGGFVVELGDGRGNNMLHNHPKQDNQESAVLSQSAIAR